MSPSDESVAISERKKVDSDLPRALSTQKAAVPWAAIALPEIKLATQNLLKAVFRKAVQVEVLVILLNDRGTTETVADVVFVIAAELLVVRQTRRRVRTRL